MSFPTGTVLEKNFNEISNKKTLEVKLEKVKLQYEKKKFN